ncbi:putative transcription factor B3-Domain family [Helianthus annuus]|nr:putative transcription factor B3-Domain family [Helianthus annuus]
MDPNSNSCSFLKVFDVLQSTKLEIPSDFVNLLWGEEIPYGDGFGKVVTDSGLQKDDYLLFTSLGPSTFYLDVFKSCVLDNSFITSIRVDDDFILMADKFWGQFYGSSYKGGLATLYVGDRFWNVKMEALSDKCAFTDGWSNLIRDLALDSRTTFIFTMAGYDTFKLSIFNYQTGTQMYFKKVDVVVLDDPIYGDHGFDLLLAYEHKEKVITNEIDLDEDIAGDIVGECTRISSSVDVYQSPNDPKGKSKIVFGHETVSPKDKPKCNSFRSTTSTAHVIETLKKILSGNERQRDAFSGVCFRPCFLFHFMAPAFVKIIYDASPSSLPLPAFYNDAVRNFGFPVGHWLPKKFMEHNFNDDILENNVTIRYAPNQERTVRIKKLWDIHYYILDFSQISTDLSLVKWDFLVFHRVETYTFNLIVFRLLGDGSLVAEIGIPLPELKPIPEPEYQAENDIEVGDQHSQTEDQIPIEDINYDNDVNVDNQVYDDEELPVHGNPPLPVNDVYEIEWVLTYRFRFPQRFVENVPLDNVKAMNVQTMNGVSVVLEIRSERSRGAPRYAFRGWERFMRQVGLVSGRAYVLRYERNNGVLVISEVIPHIF